jgi:hypothetical protein
MVCSVAAQDLKFQLTCTGNCVSNDASGKLVSRPINTQTWLHEFAVANGLSTSRGLSVIYHVAAEDLGDRIEVINSSTGDLVGSAFLLFFGESTDLGRVAITNNFNTQVKKIHYVYTYQNSHSMGSALLTERFYLDENGNTTNAVIQGLMHYLFVADYAHNLEICNVSFVTGKRVR